MQQANSFGISQLSARISQEVVKCRVNIVKKAGCSRQAALGLVIVWGGYGW